MSVSAIRSEARDIFTGRGFLVHVAIMRDTGTTPIVMRATITIRVVLAVLDEAESADMSEPAVGAPVGASATVDLDLA